jgi:hypothetical protein
MARVPDDMVSLLIADTGRARQWERGLRGLGIEGVRRIEAPAERFEQGEWQIVVPEADAPQARRYMAEVLRGDAKLPAGGIAALSPSGKAGAFGVLALIAMVIVLAAVCS